MSPADTASLLFDLLQRKPDSGLEAHRNALAQAITLVESTRSADQLAAEDLIDRCLATGSQSLRVGITGVPGVGKSTLIDALGMEWVNAGHRLAVLAIDPSSARGKGSILADKTRMDRLAAHPAVFIRPTAASGALGGVARHTREAMILCETAGYGRIIVETVGVGQNEIAVDKLVDITVLLMLAGAGDELQGIKRGIMEAADIIAITKADGDNLGRSEQARLDLRGAIAMLPPREGGRRAEVMMCSALEQQGIDRLALQIQTLADEDRRSDRHNTRRRAQDLACMHEMIEQALLERFRSDPRISSLLPQMEASVRQGSLSPFKAVAQLVALIG